MHLARVRRHGHPDLQPNFTALEKLPHPIVDDYIKNNCANMIDKDIVRTLRKMGYKQATIWTVKYRRRKLGVKKYLYGEIKKHKAWVRAQAIKRYGKECELCQYSLTVDTHHIIPKYQGGPHEIENVMIICPNCHALITRGIIKIRSRKEFPIVRRKITEFFTSSH